MGGVPAGARRNVARCHKMDGVREIVQRCNARSPICGEWPNVITAAADVEPRMSVLGHVRFEGCRADTLSNKYLNESLNFFHFTHDCA
jgi:hypothetical protein